MSDEYMILKDIHLTIKEIHQGLSKLKSSSSEWFVLIVVIYLLAGWSGSRLDRWTDRVWYSVAHSTDWQRVNINKRPVSCDFFYSPVGNKGCRYKKETIIFGDEQRTELARQATSDEERQEIAKRPNYVIVYWGKKED